MEFLGGHPRDELRFDHRLVAFLPHGLLRGQAGGPESGEVSPPEPAGSGTHGKILPSQTGGRDALHQPIHPRGTSLCFNSSGHGPDAINPVSRSDARRGNDMEYFSSDLRDEIARELVYGSKVLAS